MKRLLWLFVCVLFFALGVLLFVSEPQQKDGQTVAPVKKSVMVEEASIPEIDTFFAKLNEPVEFIDVATTKELKDLLGNYKYNETPRIFVRQFPDDFSKEGDFDTFVRTLLPHVLKENEIMQAERAAFLKLANKVKFEQPMTQKEEDFFQSLVLKYESLDPDFVSQANTLYHRIDRISPSLAVAQALLATNYMKENLTAPFDVFRWNKDKEYVRVIYPDLAKAVEDYALELNRGLSYELFHIKRSIYRGTQYELPGSAFSKGLALYKPKQVDYIDRLYRLIDSFDAYDMDFAAFKKGL